MKKLFAVVLALTLLLSAVAFAESADFVGVWYLNEMEMEGMTFSPAEFGMEMSIELKEDGSAVAVSVESDEAEESAGSWAVEGEGVTVTIDDDPMTFVLEDGNLVADSDGIRMIFGTEKVEAEVFEPAAPKADAAEADYAGNWAAFKISMDGVYYDAGLVGMDVTAVIEGTTITLDGGYLFDGDAFETTFADGALGFAVEDPDSAFIAGINAQLLEDDTLSLTLTASDDIVLILNRAE